MHPSTSQALANIDAAVFSGETLYVDADLAELKAYLARWNRAVAEHEASDRADKAQASSKTKHTTTTKLVSMNMNGNLHEVAGYLNQFGLSEFLVQADSRAGTSTVLLRMPRDWPCDSVGPKPASAT